MNTIINFIQDESGATAIEYGLIAALVSVAGITAFQSLGTSLGTMGPVGAVRRDFFSLDVFEVRQGTQPKNPRTWVSRQPRRR